MVGGVVSYGPAGATGERNGRFLLRGRSQ